MKVFSSRYQLAVRNRNGRCREGTLLRIAFPWGDGFCDICEPADEPLQRNLSLSYAWIDSIYRAEGQSMWMNAKAPLSHKTEVDWLSRTDEEWLGSTAGFPAVKFKVGENAAQEIERLLQLDQVLPSSLKFRLDFNSKCQDPEAWKPLLNTRRVELVEDPVPFDEEAWQKIEIMWNVPLAQDMAKGADGVAAPWDGLFVFKPAVQEIRPQFLLHAGIVTSYLDHPVGQGFAAWIAALIRQANPSLGICGLLTHEIVGLSDWFPEGEGPEFPHPAGNGIGFDESLEELTWKAEDEESRHDWEISPFLASHIERDIQKSLGEYWRIHD